MKQNRSVNEDTPHSSGVWHDWKATLCNMKAPKVQFQSKGELTSP